MRRRLILVGVLLLAAVAAIFGASACGDDGGSGYQVRAMFANAFTVIPGEEVKSAGVPIGTIKSLDVENRKAAVVLDITDPAFQDFREDATCKIRPQSLVGERFVECTLTAKKAPGQAEAPKLQEITSGPGKGQLLLPSSNTVNPVDIDLVNNTLQLPYRQRLTIILNELGVGLAGNGKALREAVRSADPTLAATEKVLAIFAEQNKVLAQIAEDSDRALAPLARQRAHVAGAIESINTTARATAERSTPLEAGLQKLPASLREIRPTMVALNDLADQLQPVADDLKVSGKDLSRAVVGLGGLADEGTPALKDLADTLDVGRDALVASKPILQDAKVFAADAKPIAKNLSDLLLSLKTTGGFEFLMDSFYFVTAASNGYDEEGHYLRAQAILNICISYTDVQGDGPCRANFKVPDASAGAAATTTPVRGSDRSGSVAKPTAASAAKPVALPNALLPGSATKPAAKRAPVPAGLADTKTGPSDGSAAVLDYLMGG